MTYKKQAEQEAGTTTKPSQSTGSNTTNESTQNTTSQTVEQQTMTTTTTPATSESPSSQEAFSPDTETIQQSVEVAGKVLEASSLTTTGGRVPATSTFTVTSSDPANPTVAFNGVKDKNAKALKKVGKNALKGVNSACRIKVPAKKVKTYQQLFRKKGQKDGVKVGK